MLAKKENPFSQRTTAFGNTVYLEMPLALGLAVHICWICLLFTETVMSIQGSDSTNRMNFSLFGATFLIAFFIAGFTAGFDREHITKFIRRKWAHFLISTCGVAGCVLFMLISTISFPFSIACVIPSALMIGSSFAFATVLWGEAARRRQFPKLVIITMLSFIIAFFMAIIIIRTLDAFATEILLCISPFISLVLVYKAQHDNESYFKPQEFLILADGTKQVKEGALWIETFHDLRISKGRFALKLGRSAFPFGVVFGILAFGNYQYLSSHLFAPGLFLAILLPLGAALLFVIVFFRAFHSAEYPSTSRKLFPYFIVFMLFACGDGFLGGSFANPASVALLALLGTMLWFYPAELTHRYRISALLTFGYFASFLALGILISAIGTFTISALGSSEAFLRIGLVIVFLLGFISLIKDDEMRSIALSVPSRSESYPDPYASPKRKGIFTQRCQIVADTFLLSQRELEILLPLAKGRNAAYIQRALMISEGTVRTHMRNIYRKLDVHNRQELIDLVDSTLVDLAGN